MITSISTTAQAAPTFVPTVFDNTLPSGMGTPLDRIRCGEPVARVYRDETRPWWDLVDEDRVYEAIADDRFRSFVRLVVATA